jgi:hypothetical protein
VEQRQHTRDMLESKEMMTSVENALQVWFDTFSLEKSEYSTPGGEKRLCKEMLEGAKKLNLEDQETLEEVGKHLLEVAKKSDALKRTLDSYLNLDNPLRFKREHRLELSLRLIGMSERERQEVIQMK